MTFASIASKSTHDLTVPNTIKLSKISIAGSLLAIVSVTVLQNLLWMSVSSPAELPKHQTPATLSTVK
jgi:hypothetical protein